MTEMFEASSRSYQEFRVSPGLHRKALREVIAWECVLSEPEAEDLIDFGSVHVDGRQQRRPETQVSTGQTIRVYWPWHGVRRFYEIDEARIVYRDRWILAYDKEPGIPSQQTPSDAYNNVFAALKRHLEKQRGKTAYVALHQRLDQETSGVMIFATDRRANKGLGRAFQERQVQKYYLAWVAGVPKQSNWVVRRCIGRGKGRYRVCDDGRGRWAETAFRVIHREEARTLLEARPVTGRTHQIRLHLASEGLPVLGDRLYGSPEAQKGASRLMLHAHRLVLPHPFTGRSLTLIAPMPDDWPPVPHRTIPD